MRVSTNSPRLVLLTLGFVLVALAVQAQDKDNIIAVIKKETNAYHKADYDTWQSCWLHSPHSYFSYASPDDHIYQSGWKAIDEAYRDQFSNPRPVSHQPHKKDFNITMSGDMAFVTFDQVNEFETGQRDINKESRVMKKTDEGWKIMSLQLVNHSAYFGNNTRMLHHVVVADFTEEASASDIQYIADQLQSLTDEIDGMKSCTWHQNLDEGNPNQYTWVMTFETHEALEEFQRHTEHKKAIERWMPINERVITMNSWK